MLIGDPDFNWSLTPIVPDPCYSYILTSAIKRANSADPAKVTEVLRKIDGFAPVTGSMKWDEKGEQRYGVVSVYKVNGGRWESIIRSDNW